MTRNAVAEPARALRGALVGVAALAMAACDGPDSDTHRPPDETARPDTDTDVPDTDPPEVTISIRAAAAKFDECGGFCVDVEARIGPRPIVGETVTIEGEIDGFFPGATAVLDAHGHALVCADGPETVGQQRIAAHVGDAVGFSNIEVAPFGYSYGLERPGSAIAPEDLWIPTISGLTDPPLLSWEADSWEATSVMMPSTVQFQNRRLLYYAGSTDDDLFSLGVAWRSTDTAAFEKYEGNPILTADQTGAQLGDFDYYAQNTPEALVVGDEVWLYYDGRSGDDGGLSIGLATSTDGFHFTRRPAPVLPPTGNEDDFDGLGVAHPSVVEHDGIYEMWYASGTLQIGYAISDDGLHFERYCKGAVFSGDRFGWDEGHVKAPEVALDGDRYRMTFSGCGQGCYQVGWAESMNGVQWTAAPQPLFDVQDAPAWNSYGTQAAFIVPGTDTWTYWYAGTGNDHGAIGIATSPAPGL